MLGGGTSECGEYGEKVLGEGTSECGGIGRKGVRRRNQ